MKVQNPPAASHLTQSRNQRPCNGHKVSSGANFFFDLYLEFTDSEFYEIFCSYVNLCVLLGEAHVACYQIPEGVKISPKLKNHCLEEASLLKIQFKEGIY